MVILAILAAILVPALLGWIDEAKKKQYVLDARNIYMATQAAIDEMYAADSSQPMPTTINATTAKTQYDRIVQLSDTSFTEITIPDGGYADKAAIQKMTITGLKGKTATLANNTWSIS